MKLLMFAFITDNAGYSGINYMADDVCLSRVGRLLLSCDVSSVTLWTDTDAWLFRYDAGTGEYDIGFAPREDSSIEVKATLVI